MKSAEGFRTIRDFIYLNTPKLYSLYAQVFEGVGEQILEEYLDQKSTKDKTKGSLLFAGSNEGVESVRRTVSVVLHDHMYNALEGELGETLQSADHISPDDIFRISSETPLIKVHGPAEIEDYERLRSFTGEFNKMGEAIAYSGQSSQIQPEIDLLKASLKTTNQPRRKQVEDQIKHLGDYKQRARDMGLYQDPKSLENIQLFIDLFSESNYHVAISPPESDIRYRGVIEKDWLRVNPAVIKSMYGGQSEFSWTMVGAITYVPGTRTDWAERTKELAFASPFGEGQIGIDLPSILDAFRNSFRALKNMERMFLESAVAHEVIMSPLAIYREFRMPLGEKRVAPVFGTTPARRSPKKAKDQDRLLDE